MSKVSIEREELLKLRDLLAGNLQYEPIGTLGRFILTYENWGVVLNMLNAMLKADAPTPTPSYYACGKERVSPTETPAPSLCWSCCDRRECCLRSEKMEKCDLHTQSVMPAAAEGEDTEKDERLNDPDYDPMTVAGQVYVTPQQLADTMKWHTDGMGHIARWAIDLRLDDIREEIKAAVAEAMKQVDNELESLTKKTTMLAEAMKEHDEKRRHPRWHSR